MSITQVPHQQNVYMAFSAHDLSQSHFMTVAKFDAKSIRLIYDLFTSFHSFDHASHG